MPENEDIKEELEDGKEDFSSFDYPTNYPIYNAQRRETQRQGSP